MPATMSFKKDFNNLVKFIFDTNDISQDSVEITPQMKEAKCVRNVVKARIEVAKEFLDHKLKANRQTCPHCDMPLRQLRAEHNSKLFYAKGVSSRALKKNKLSHMNNKFTKSVIKEQMNTDDLQLEEEEQNGAVEQPMIEDDIECWFILFKKRTLSISFLITSIFSFEKFK
jgi:hypothetical protein